MAERLSIPEITHPEYAVRVQEWVKFWLAYEGGRAFIAAYLRKYSKRETRKDFENRVAVTYNPPEAQSALNDVRDALLVRMHEVTRTGDPLYVDMMNQDVDTFRSSMATFIGENILPRLLAQGKVYAFVDAPPTLDVPAGTPAPTRAEDPARPPYLWSFSAEQCKSWTYGDDGRITSCLVYLTEDVIDPLTGLTIGVAESYKLMKLLGAGEYAESIVGPGVAIITYDKLGTVKGAELLNLDRVPVVEFKIAQALMTDIADIQVALLNLASTDMAFLFRGNFPLYTEQYDPATDVIRPTAKKRDSTTNDQSHDSFDDETSERGSSVGVGKGRRYQKGVERPGYVSPPTANLDASMRKQDDLSKRIRTTCDLALTSLSVAAIEQSGESKKQDRVGLSAGLRYIATQLENGEREVNDIVHQYLGSTPEDATVEYPDEYSMPDDEQRTKELDRLTKSRSAVRSRTYQKELSKQIARSQLAGVVPDDKIELVLKEIDAEEFMDESVERSVMVQGDVQARLISRETGSLLRGYAPGEIDKRIAEDQVIADQRAGYATGSEGMTDPMGSAFVSDKEDKSAEVPAGSTPGTAGEDDTDEDDQAAGAAGA